MNRIRFFQTCLCAIAITACPVFAGSLDAIPAAQIKRHATEIDRLIEADLKAAKLTPNADADDATFLRRVTLTIAGRIPTGPELEAFLKSREPAKRTQAIDRLLNSTGYDSHMYHWGADLLRATTRSKESGPAYVDFIKDAIATNKPYDQFVRELITATGSSVTRGNGATGYYLRDKGMPQDNMSNTVRIFLGTRLECAQCHNHPFDKWTQMDYFRMVAFTGGLSYYDDEFKNSKRGEELAALEKQLKSDGKPAVAKGISKTTESLRYGISGTGTGVVRLPHDYQYPDAKPDQVVVAKTMFGLDAKMAEPQFKEDTNKKTSKKGKNKSPGLKADDIDARQAYAQWMTAPENPRFTTVIANRMWHRVMGIGLIEPLDNFTDQTEASHPELMAYLDQVMVELKYDLKQFQRVLLNTRTFGRATSTTEAIAGEKFHYQGPVLRRLSAEQIWDSMLTLITEDPDATLTPPGEGSMEKYYNEYDKLMTKPVAEILKDAEEYALRYTMTKEERTAYQAKQRAEEKAAFDAIAKKAGPVLDDLKKAAKSDDDKAVHAAVKKLQAMGVPEKLYERYTQTRTKDKKNANTSLARGLARASELESPARPGHFLRDFGQSDRDTIEAAHTEPAVPQVLSLLNGYVEKYVIANPKSAVLAGIESRNTPDAKIREAFLRVLSREPLSEERFIWRGQIDRFGTDAYKDLVWTLTNTHEFLFLR